MDKAFHSHTAAADMASKQEIYDLMVPQNALSSEYSSRFGTASEAEKAAQKGDVQNVENVGAEKKV